LPAGNVCRRLKYCCERLIFHTERRVTEPTKRVNGIVLLSGSKHLSSLTYCVQEIRPSCRQFEPSSVRTRRLTLVVVTYFSSAWAIISEHETMNAVVYTLFSFPFFLVFLFFLRFFQFYVGRLATKNLRTKAPAHFPPLFSLLS